MPIRAFIGHSFTPDDATVVQAFLDYFDTLSTLPIDFSWDHARQAEPVGLVEKVLSIIEDKNLFIGICTKKELVVSRERLSTSVFRNKWCANTKDYSWKTSDWVVQEIGLAIGRRMKIIVLLEDGVRNPGGLQGDLEYISFNRNAPERAFKQILEMITKLMPTDVKIEVAAPPQLENASNESSAPAKEEEHWSKPKIDWDKDDFEQGIWFAAVTKKNELFLEIDESFLVSSFAKSEQSKLDWQALKLSLEARYLGSTGLERLREVISGNNVSSKIWGYYAETLSHFSEPEASGDCYLKAAEICTNDLDTARYLLNASQEFLSADSDRKATEAIVQLRQIAQRDSNAEPVLLDAIANLAEHLKTPDARAAAQERWLQIRPDNKDLRFKIAYEYQNRGKDSLSIHHWIAMPPGQRDSTSWNNLGVSYARESLPGLSIAAYRTSVTKGAETLAMANMAFKFLEQGFIKEAKELCSEAMKADHPHENVAKAISAINDMEDKEDERRKEILSQTKPISRTMARIGGAMERELTVSLAGLWVGPLFNLEISVSGNGLKAKGAYIPSTGTQVEIAAGTMDIEIVSKQFGCAALGTIERKRRSQNALTMLSFAQGSDDVVLMASDDGSMIEVIEKYTSKTPQAYLLSRGASVLVESK